MKKKLLITLFILGSISSRADTITSWTFYLNKTKLKTCTDFTQNKITIKANTLKSSDILELEYFDDTPCHNCEYLITIKDEYKGRVSTKKFTGKNNLIKLDLKDILEHYHKQFEGRKVFFLIFIDGINKDKSIKNGRRLLELTLN